MAINFKFKKLRPEAVIPSLPRQGDAGIDLTAIDLTISPDGVIYTYGTGLAVETAEESYPGVHLLLLPRSSIYKTDLMLANGVGLIDASYRGELKVVFRAIQSNFTNLSFKRYNIGDRIAQLTVFSPSLKFTITEINELSTTERGEGGFGSTGK